MAMGKEIIAFINKNYNFFKKKIYDSFGLYNIIVLIYYN